MHAPAQRAPPHGTFRAQPVEVWLWGTRPERRQCRHDRCLRLRPWVVAHEFPTDLAVLTEVVENQQTVRLWKQLPVTLVAGILDQIRSKALKFVLEIEAANPRRWI